MRTTSAYVAARAAFGGNDMLSKWQLMAEQARQKREVSTDSTSISQPTRIENDRQETEKMSPTGPIPGKQ